MVVSTKSACSLLAMDMIRHQRDHETRLSEGVEDVRGPKEQVFRNSCALMTPVTLACLNEMNEILFDGTGTVRAVEPHSDGAGGLIATWEITWPALEAAVVKNSGEPYLPCRLAAIFPVNASRGHLAMLHQQHLENTEGAIGMFGPDVVCTWPIQVTSEEDAEHLEPLIWTIVMGQIHETTVHAGNGWDVFPKYETPDSWGHASKEPVFPKGA